MPSRNDEPSLPAQVLQEGMHLAIPSLPHWIEPTAEYLKQKAILSGACKESRSGKLLVALHEALTNAVVHGNLEISSKLKERDDDAFAKALAERSANADLSDRAVDVRYEYDGETCLWTITDQGQGFDVDTVLKRCLSDDPEVMLASGRGILMMHSFLDGVQFELGGRRVLLSMQRLSADEKRNDPRVPVHLPLHVAPIRADGSVDWSAAYDAVSRNVSQNGLALLQDQLTQGQRVLIGITVAGQLQYVPAEIRHTRPMGSKGIELGCEFVTQGLSNEQDAAAQPEQVRNVQQVIAEILEKLHAPELPGHERRGHPRVSFNRPVDVYVEGLSAPLVGYARDLSKGGMSLITQNALADVVIVGFVPKDGRPELRIRARVVRCAKIQQGFFDVGVQFLRLETPAAR
jgi:anti-sigma regulatory factor (Ser/Thr protein kinase)